MILNPELMLSVAPWPYRDLLSCIMYQFVSLFQLPEQYITLAVLCLAGCVCAAEAPEPTEEVFLSLSQRHIEVEVPTDLPFGHNTTQRPPTGKKRYTVLCIGPVEVFLSGSD